MITIFRSQIFTVGGIESWLYYIAKKYHDDYDIQVYYDDADVRQISRLSKYVKCIKYNGQTVKCDKAIYCYDFMGIETTEANEYLHIVHADYDKINLRPTIPNKINRIFGVSKLACSSFTKKFGMKCELLYNPVDITDTEKPIKLVSATRLTIEKGLERMRELARVLDNKGVSYQWDIFTNQPGEIDSPNVTFRKPKLDIAGDIKTADYLVQLSDTESYCYSVVEALSLGTKVIATDIPVLKELGVTDKYGVIIDLEETNYDTYVDAIISRKDDTIEYTPPDDNYKSILGKKEKSKYRNDMLLVQNLRGMTTYMEEKQTLREGDFMFVKDSPRTDMLVKEKYVKIIR